MKERNRFLLSDLLSIRLNTLSIESFVENRKFECGNSVANTE